MSFQQRAWSCCARTRCIAILPSGSIQRCSTLSVSRPNMRLPVHVTLTFHLAGDHVCVLGTHLRSWRCSWFLLLSHNFTNYASVQAMALIACCRLRCLHTP